MSFAIVHTQLPVVTAAPIAVTPPAQAIAEVKPTVVQRSVSARATVIVPEAANHWATVTVALPAFHTTVAKLVEYTVVQTSMGLVVGAARCLPWVGVLASLIATSGVGVAACLVGAGAQRNIQHLKDRHDPLPNERIVKLRETYDAVQKAAEGDPLKQAAQRHVVITHLVAALKARGLCPEGELMLQDLQYAAAVDDPIDAAGKRSASAAHVLQPHSQLRFGDVQPYEAVALRMHYRRDENHNSAVYDMVRALGDRGQNAIDEAVSVEIQRIVNRQLDG